MATRKQKVQVGVFLVTCTVLIALGFIIMSGVRAEPQIPYQIEFKESILGLSVGSYVMYRGVPVGKVSDITVTEDFEALVDIYVLPSKVKSLRKGVTAQLVLYNIAAGSMCVSLEGGSPNAPILKPGSMIPTRPSLVNEVSSRIGEFLGDAQEILGKIRDGMKGMRPGDIKKVIDHTDELVQQTHDFLADADDTINSVKGDAQKSIANFRALTEDLRHLTKDADNLVNTINDKVKPLDVADTGKELRKLLDNLNDLSNRLKKAVDTLNGVSKTVASDTDNVQYSLRNILDQASQTMQAMQDVLNVLKQNPSAIIWGKGRPKGEK